MFVYAYGCVWGDGEVACLNEVAMKSDPVSNIRAKGTFMETVEDRNKVVTGGVPKQHIV